MKLFACSSCGRPVYFENTRCGNCGHRLGYRAESADMTALDEAPDGTWQVVPADGPSYRFCANAVHDTCNWLIPAGDPAQFCLACRHNRTVPDISSPERLTAWKNIEFAKHRLFYTLIRLGLPLPGPGEGAEPLVFDFLADTAPTPNGPKVMTGHDNGVITIALAEADDAEREKRRAAMGEPYRTLLGHFRHEVGHFYWDILVRDGGKLAECRAVFGNDEEDYQEALKRHYEEGVPADWQEHFISAYATTHAWEDFAESWAHYLHIIDCLEMADSFGLSVSPTVGKAQDLAAKADVDVYGETDIGRIVETWVRIGFALNSINRCMGETDLYPFVLSPAVIGKIGFMHRLVHGRV